MTPKDLPELPEPECASAYHAETLVYAAEEVLDIQREAYELGARSTAAQPIEMSDERIDHIAELVVKGMPEGIQGFMKSWGWRQFARALLADCAGHVAAQPAAAQPVETTGLQQIVDGLVDALNEIGDYAHDRSTGPAVPDALWEIRGMAYVACDLAAAPPAASGGISSLSADGDPAARVELPTRTLMERRGIAAMASQQTSTSVANEGAGCVETLAGSRPTVSTQQCNAAASGDSTPPSEPEQAEVERLREIARDAAECATNLQREVLVLRRQLNAVQGDPSGALRPEPEAVGQGRWIAVTERMPENDDEVLVWVTSPWAKTAYAAIDSWHMHREDPTGMGGPTLEMGYMWREYEAEDITHWQRVEPPQAASGSRGD